MRVLFFLLWSISSVGQPPAIINIAKDCSEKDLKNNLYYLAGPALEGRMMGSHGDTLASRYVADWFKANGLKAPYARGKSYYQDITVTRQTDESTLSIGNKDYEKFDGWEIYPQAPIKLTQLSVLFADYDDLENLLADLPKINVKGKAMIVSDKAYLKAFPTKIDSIETILKNQGLLLLVWYNGRVKKYVENSKAKSFIPEYVQNPASTTDPIGAFPELGLSTEKISPLLNGEKIEVIGDGEFKSTLPSHFFDLNVTVGVEVKRTFKEEHAPNIIGVIPGADASLPCIVVSAHHDHDGINGKEIYYGAVDNASGTATIMQLATMMKAAIAKGLRPKRTIVFASFTGEERGLLGSFYYVDHPLFPMQQTYANLNLDMLGRVDTFYSGKKADSNYVYILVKDSAQRHLREKLYKANSVFSDLKLDTYYEDPQREQRRLKGSDQYPFFLKGIPFVRIDCGFCSDYHKPTDTPDKINYPLLKQQMQLAFLTLWNMAND